MSDAESAPALREIAGTARSNPAAVPLATLFAFVLLVATDLFMKLAPFSLFYRFVRWFPVRGRTGDRAWIVARTCRSFDRAASYYFKRAWCLQRSAATALLLRLRGVPAHLVIGVERFPFYAHAWVEVEGRVVNDSPEVAVQCTVLERC